MVSHIQQLPNTSSVQTLTEFVLVEYPGVIKNVQDALDTLGGVRTISNAHFNNGQLELQFRPDNPFHSSLAAERRNQSAVFSGQANLVLRIRRRKRRGEAKPQMTEENDVGGGGPLDIRCIGMISAIYSFRNICDFQYLPLSNTTTTLDPAQGVSAHHDLIPCIVPVDFTSALSWWDEQQQQAYRKEQTDGQSTLTQEVTKFLPPYQFSRYNTPSKFILRDDVERWLKKNVEGTGHGKSLRNERKALTVTVNANDPFPLEPSVQAIKDVSLRCKNSEMHQMFTQLFAERPLWTRIAISYSTRLTDAMLKIVLAKYAFYITSGPWGRLWCRFGYDPRLDPNARCFQSIVVSFKKNQYIPERQRLKASVSHGVVSGQFFDYVYRTKVLPSLRQMWYCVCDVQLPIAQKICRRDYLETLRECDPNNGWLPAGRIDDIRAAIKADVAVCSARMDDEEEGGGGGRLTATPSLSTIRSGGIGGVDVEEENDREEDEDDELMMMGMEEGGRGNGLEDEDDTVGRMMTMVGEAGNDYDDE